MIKYHKIENNHKALIIDDWLILHSRAEAILYKGLKEKRWAAIYTLGGRTAHHYDLKPPEDIDAIAAMLSRKA